MVPGQAATWTAVDVEPLLEAYAHFLLSEQVSAQGRALGEELVPEQRRQVDDVMEGWNELQRTRIRERLEETLGAAESRHMFESFVGAMSQAEQSRDEAFLTELQTALGKRADDFNTYEDVRRHITQNHLSAELEAGAELLAEIQTWADMVERSDSAMTLYIWLSRSGAPPETESPARPVDALRAAEAPVPDDSGWTEVEVSSPMSAYAQSRTERRERVREQAMAGMQQMAQEREAAEQEYAARQMEAAQADAENMRRQAEKLAAVDAEALEQRKNSWGNRLLGIAGATLQAGVGGFTGAVGARAATEAVDAIFN